MKFEQSGIIAIIIIEYAIQGVIARKAMMQNPFKKAVMLIVAVLIFTFFVAAGIDTASFGLAEAITLSVSSAETHYFVLAGLISIWLVTVGLMCLTLKNIPSVCVKRDK